MKPNGIVTRLLLFLLLGGHVVRALKPSPRRGGFDSNVFRSRTNPVRDATHCASNGRNHKTLAAPIQMRGWDGDDVRWTSRFRRKFLRRRLRLDTTITSRAKTGLISMLILLYGYQILTTIIAIKRKFPSYWPKHAVEMIADAIWGSAVVNGPLTNTFGFSAAFSKADIPYRYITSGLFHSGLLHLLINLGVLSRQPAWLATGLGGPLYLTTFFGSIVAGNVAHVLNSSDRIFDVSLYLGSSAGICGLFGLMFVCLTRIANINPTNGGASSGQLLRGMAIMIGLGLWMDNVNTAMNVGGFFGGIFIGILCGPLYKKDYGMRRKNSAGYDPVYRDYRSVMGFGIMPTESGLISLNALYAVLLAVALSIPRYRDVPVAITRGLLNAI